MPRAVEQPSGQPGDLCWRPVPYSAWAKLFLYGLQAKNGLYILKWYNNKNQIRSYKSPCIMSVSVQKSVKPATCPLVTTHEGSEILSYLQVSKRGHCSVMGLAGDRRLQGQKIWTSSLPQPPSAAVTYTWIPEEWDGEMHGTDTCLHSRRGILSSETLELS